MMYGSWFGTFFLPFYHPPPYNDPKNQNFDKKWKKCLEVLFFYTYICTINEDHMIHGSWNIVQHREIFAISGHFFLLFQPLDILKNQNFTLNKHLEILSFYTCVPKMTITQCMVPEMSSTTNRIFCHFEPFYALLPKKSTFWKNEKNASRC